MLRSLITTSIIIYINLKRIFSLNANYLLIFFRQLDFTVNILINISKTLYGVPQRVSLTCWQQLGLNYAFNLYNNHLSNFIQSLTI